MAIILNFVTPFNKLPLQKQSGMQNALQYTTAYTKIDFNEAIPPELIGNVSLDEMIGFVNRLKVGDVQIPAAEAKTQEKPQVGVPVNIEVEENDQKSVDAGHSPWKLDPVFVAQVFVSLKISPEGIQGDYPIKYEELKITQNTGKDAIVEVNGVKTSISRVYLKKLIRQDKTGIWTVVGYDPIKQ